MGAINSSDRIATTLYSLGTWFVSGMYVCIKEDKGDSDDDDDDYDCDHGNISPTPTGFTNKVHSLTSMTGSSHDKLAT
jgi:hypothetical protein